MDPNLQSRPIENVHLREGILSNFLCFQGIRTYLLGNPETSDHTHRQQICHTIFSDKNHSTNLMERM